MAEAVPNIELSALARRLARAAVTADADYNLLQQHYAAVDRDPAMITYDLEDGIRLVLGLEVS